MRSFKKKNQFITMPIAVLGLTVGYLVSVHFKECALCTLVNNVKELHHSARLI